MRIDEYKRERKLNDRIKTLQERVKNAERMKLIVENKNDRLVRENRDLLVLTEDLRYRNERLEGDMATMKQLLSWRGKRKYNATQRKIDASQLYR